MELSSNIVLIVVLIVHPRVSPIMELSSNIVYSEYAQVVLLCLKAKIDTNYS